MKNLKLVAGIICLCFLSFSIGKFSGPKATSEVVKIDESKTKEIEKIKHEKETTLPDGTKIKETTTETKSKSETDKKTTSEVKTENRANWRANVLYFPEIPTVQEKNIILGIEKRIAGELYLGVSVSTQKQIGLSISLGF